MRFHTPDWNVKRHAKRLKKDLRAHGYDVSYTDCLNLMARLYGSAHFSELQKSSWDVPLSAFDVSVDGETLKACFMHQERVKAQAGFADIAGAVLDEVNETGRGNRPAMFDETAEVAVGGLWLGNGNRCRTGNDERSELL
jgi:hypothetical protein